MNGRTDAVQRETNDSPAVFFGANEADEQDAIESDDKMMEDSQDLVACITPTPATTMKLASSRGPSQAVPTFVPSTLLLRLFESSLFSMDLALQYMHTASEEGVQQYLTQRLSTFANEDVDFYLPQLVTMCFRKESLGLNGYLMKRCLHSMEFSMHVAWLLETHQDEAPLSTRASLKELQLERGLYLSDTELPQCLLCCLELKNMQSGPLGSGQFAQTTMTTAAATTTNNSNSSPSNGAGPMLDYCPCVCHSTDLQPGPPSLMNPMKPEHEFLRSLFDIARRLTQHQSKEQRSSQLSAELATLNLKLPAKVWLPVHKKRHIVLRIPPNAAVCLNSKDRAPFLVYVEILECEDLSKVKLPTKSTLSSRANSMISLSGLAGLEANGAAGASAYQSFGGTFQAFFRGLRAANVPKNGAMPGVSTVPRHSCSSTTGLLPDISAAKAIAAPDTISMISSDTSLSDERYSSSSGPVALHRSQSTCGVIQSSPGNEQAAVNPVATCTVTFKLEEDDASTRTPRESSVSGPVESEVEQCVVLALNIRNNLREYSENLPQVAFQADPEDPSAAVLKEPWESKCARIQSRSPWGHLPGWKLTAAIVKVGDDLRQEQMAYQLLQKLNDIWRIEGVKLWLRPLEIVATSVDTGLIEPVPDTVSFHQIKRHAKLSLLDYMIREHGSMNSAGFIRARDNFVHSCAAYCLVGYLFQVKDRHNGNILLDSAGHVIHIDFGFMLSASPGKNLGFETSPFKLTHEQVTVMGGIKSSHFQLYKSLILRGLLAARKHMDDICVMVDIQRLGYPKLPCFARGGRSTVDQLRQRFHLNKTEDQLRQFVQAMVDNSLHSLTTRLYDSFQYYTNGIQ